MHIKKGLRPSETDPSHQPIQKVLLSAVHILRMLQNKKIALCMAIFAIAMIGLAILGGWRSYSPVPVWDMWYGILQFYMDVENGNHAVWWAQFNEHRIVLSRILFWLDYRFFGGMSAFLIVCNYCIVAAAAYLFWRILDVGTAINHRYFDTSSRLILFFFITAWLFLWTQTENFTLAFQSQFFLAQLLPLCALFWLGKSVSPPHTRRSFLIACIFGLLSIGTMANGILALPLMCLCVLFLRQGIRKLAILLVLSAATIFVYFHDYHAPAYHGHLLSELKENPIGLLQYTLVYLGSPFGYLVGKGGFGQVVAGFMGFVLIAGASRITLKVWRTPKESAIQIALLCYILYILGTAFGTAGGRLIFGVDQALSGRYTTPAIMAWSAFFILLYLQGYFFTQNSIKKSVYLGMMVLGIFMLVRQVQALDRMEEMTAAGEVAILGLSLDVQDSAYAGKVSPHPTSEIAHAAYDRKLSLFGKYPYLGLKETLFTSFPIPAEKCEGHLDLIEDIPEETHFVRVHGWIFSPNTHTSPKLIRFVDAKGKIVGFALSGTPRRDVRKSLGKKARLAGFRGYVLHAEQKEITAVGDKPACYVKF
jgi:hypothetical protein